MEFCKSGQISNYCHPNALMTLAEYLADYASGPTKEKACASSSANWATFPAMPSGPHARKTSGTS